MARRGQGRNNSALIPWPVKAALECEPAAVSDLLEGNGLCFLQPMAGIIADLRRMAADLEDWDRFSGTEATVALQDAVHAMQRAIFAAQELDAASEIPNYAEQWIG